jgi:hypothetical protein
MEKVRCVIKDAGLAFRSIIGMGFGMRGVLWLTSWSLLIATVASAYAALASVIHFEILGALAFTGIGVALFFLGGLVDRARARLRGW